MHPPLIKTLQLIKQARQDCFPLCRLIALFQDRVVGKLAMEEEFPGHASHLGLVPTLLIQLEQVDAPVNDTTAAIA